EAKLVTAGPPVGASPSCRTIRPGTTSGGVTPAVAEGGASSNGSEASAGATTARMRGRATVGDEGSGQGMVSTIPVVVAMAGIGDESGSRGRASATAAEARRAQAVARQQTFGIDRPADAEVAPGVVHGVGIGGLGEVDVAIDAGSGEAVVVERPHPGATRQQTNPEQLQIARARDPEVVVVPLRAED